jgi:hypothetical protein
MILVAASITAPSALSHATLMTSRRSLEDAEAYELASVGSERSTSPPGNSSYPPKADDGAEDDALLSDGRRRSEYKEGDGATDDEGRADTRLLDGNDEEIVGKGEGVEALIARVSHLGGKPSTRSPLRIPEQTLVTFFINDIILDPFSHLCDLAASEAKACGLPYPDQRYA